LLIGGDGAETTPPFMRRLFPIARPIVAEPRAVICRGASVAASPMGGGPPYRRKEMRRGGAIGRR
jgi:hypothetical protein